MFKKYFANYLSPSDMYKKLRETEGERNESQVYSIKKVLKRLKETIKNVSNNKKLIIEENKKIINIADNILNFTLKEQKKRVWLKNINIKPNA